MTDTLESLRAELAAERAAKEQAQRDCEMQRSEAFIARQQLLGFEAAHAEAADLVTQVGTEISTEDLVARFKLAAPRRVVDVILHQFAALFDSTEGAVNYIEMLYGEEGGRQFVVTLRRREGKTPDEMRIAAEARVATLQAELDALKLARAGA